MLSRFWHNKRLVTRGTRWWMINHPDYPEVYCVHNIRITRDCPECNDEYRKALENASDV